MNIIEHARMDEERALYGSHDVLVRDCAFDGPADGESALKESRDVTVERTLCNLRYPFWHDTRLSIRNCELTELCRAAIWYSEDVSVEDSRLHGIKALRECRNARLQGCDVRSPEFGWLTRGLNVTDCTFEGEYFLFGVQDLHMTASELTGKYSFQYVKDAVIEHCTLNTKDAFWHAENVTVRDSVVRGEYLAWYSKGLTLERCTIIGTQPLCYCEDLTLIDCEMIDTDLSFERSHVNATLRAPIHSIKNPTSGTIRVPAVGEIILDDENAHGQIVVG